MKVQFLFALAGLALASQANAGAVIVSGDAAVSSFDKAGVQGVFLGRDQKVGDAPVALVFQRAGTVREKFDADVLGKPGSQLTAHWSRLIFTGRADIMGCIAPLGPVYQAGTLSGNPLATTAGLATLERLEPALYERLEKLGAMLEAGLDQAIAAAGVEACVQRVGSMITLFFTKGPVRSFNDAVRADTTRFGRWHREMLARGQYWPPSQFEAAFVSCAHTEADVDRTIEASNEALASIA